MLNRESEYLISMLVGFDFMEGSLHRMINRYPDDEVLKFTLQANKPFRDSLLDKIEQARLMNPYLEEVVGEDVNAE